MHSHRRGLLRIQAQCASEPITASKYGAAQKFRTIWVADRTFVRFSSEMGEVMNESNTSQFAQAEPVLRALRTTGSTRYQSQRDVSNDVILAALEAARSGNRRCEPHGG
ncbi:MAG: hypothetical protein RLZ37_212 [Actinomycetota bacterium]